MYLTRSFGPWAGFLFGWAQLVVVLTASIGAMAVVFGEFATGIKDLKGLLPVDFSSELIYAVGAIVVLSLLNILGVALGKLAQNLLTLAKVIGLLAILVAGFGWPQSSPTEWAPSSRPSSAGARSPSFWFFMPTAAGMTRRSWPPRFAIGSGTSRALILGVGLITLIYLLVNAAYITGLGFEQARQADRLPALLLLQPFGKHGGMAMSVLVMISALGAANGLIFTGARVYATLGNDYPLFGWLGHWRPGRGAPILALLVQALITVGMLLALGTEQGHEHVNELLRHAGRIGEYFGFDGIEPQGSWSAGSAFETLVSHTAPVFWFFFLMTGLSLFILRANNPNLTAPFSVPLYPVLPIIFCNMCVYMLYQSVLYVGWRALFAVGLVLLGLPLYWLSRRVGYRGT